MPFRTPFHIPFRKLFPPFTLTAFNRNSAQLFGAVRYMVDYHMSDRDCSELYCLLSACTFDGQINGYSQLQATLNKFAFVRTNRNQLESIENPRGRGGGGGRRVLWFSFAGYVPLASQSPCPIIIYFVASYRPHLSHFWKNVIFRYPN